MALTAKIAWDYDPTIVPQVASFVVYKLDSKTGSPTYGTRLGKLSQSATLPTTAAPLTIPGTVTVPGTASSPSTLTLDFGMNQIEITAVDASGGESPALTGNFSLTLPSPTNFRKVG
jgi:hypothetical protein